MHLTIDFESRSPEDITLGPSKYWAHPLTQVCMLSMKVDDTSSRIWLPPWVLEMHPMLALEFDLITDEERDYLTESADIIEAHNKMFEDKGWEERMVKLYGALPIPPEKWRCSAANAARFKLPRDLDGLCNALDIAEKKDSEGHDLMKKMCKPLRWEDDKPVYIEDYDSFKREIEYCLQDTEAEYAASQALPPMPEYCLKTWRLDQKINARGVAVDVKSLRRVVEYRENHFEPLRETLRFLTQDVGGLTPTQTQKLTTWIKERGVEIPDLRADTVELYKNDESVPEEVRQVLEIRSVVGKSSLAKVDKMLECVCEDGRVRDILMYHGAGPGRFTGKGIQVQNFPRASTDLFDDIIRDLVLEPEVFELLYGPVGPALVECMRGMICAEDGFRFVNGDFSSVEARWVAWFCKDEKMLEIFATHGKVYEAAAASIFGVSIDDIGKESFERLVGKVCELALQYGGGVLAFVSMGRVYKLDLSKLVDVVFPTATQEEIEWSTKIVKMMFSDKKLAEHRITRDTAIACDIIKARWRKSRPCVTSAWYGLNDCATKAVKNPGAVYQYNGAYFGMTKDNRFLRMSLPSGRCLYYYKPKVGKSIPPWVDPDLPKEEQLKQSVENVTYACAKGGGGLKRMAVHGGILLENHSQGGCADLMTEAMHRCEDAEYEIAITVHDEIMSEVLEDFGSLAEFIGLLEVKPEWAQDFPLKASGWEGPRFKK